MTTTAHIFFRQAYTLIEVLVTVSIMGVAAAVVVPAMLQPGSMNIQSAARMVIADIVFAQNEAIAQQATRRVAFDPTLNRYSITDGSGNTITEPWISGTGGNYVVDFSGDSRFQGVTLSAAAFGPGSTVEFDALGSPTYGGTVDLQAGNLKYRVTVSALTGRVTIASITGGN